MGAYRHGQPDAQTPPNHLNLICHTPFCSNGGIGKTTQELRSPADYIGIYADRNVDINGDNLPDDPWDFGTSTQYPVLKYVGLDVAAQRR